MRVTLSWPLLVAAVSLAVAAAASVPAASVGAVTSVPMRRHSDFGAGHAKRVLSHSGRRMLNNGVSVSPDTNAGNVTQ